MEDYVYFCQYVTPSPTQTPMGGVRGMVKKKKFCSRFLKYMHCKTMNYHQ